MKSVPFFGFFGLLFMLISCKKENFGNLSDIGYRAATPPTTKILSPTEGNGLMINLCADAIGNYPPFNSDIDKLSKQQTINALNSYINSYCGSQSQVKAIALNVNYQRTCYDSKVMDPYWHIDNPDKNLKNWPVQFWKMHKKGVDAFDVCIKQCRKNGVEPWISIRMNDNHFFNDSTMVNRFWFNNPNMRLYSGAMFDFTNSSVRDYYIELIKEVLVKYDVDGIELDWMRFYTVFRNGTGSQKVDLINSMMMAVRNYTAGLAKLRGHNIKVSVRLPPDPGYSKYLGFDGVFWAQSGLVDLIVVTNFMHPTNFDLPIDVWKTRIGNSKCLIYASTDEAVRLVNSKYCKNMTTNIDIARGFSYSALSRGADGIYLFNHVLPSWNTSVISSNGSVQNRNDKTTILQDAGRFSRLVGKSRTFVYSYREPDWSEYPSDFYNVNSTSEFTYNINLGVKADTGVYTARVGIDNSIHVFDADFYVIVNGFIANKIKDLPRTPGYNYDNSKIFHYVKNISETSARVLQFDIPLAYVKSGYNEIRIRSKNKNDYKITWLDISYN